MEQSLDKQVLMEEYLMKMEEITLEIRDIAKNTTETTKLTLVDGAYRIKIETITEAYKYMLPGDTITIVYAVFKNRTEFVNSFEVDYTFPESRLHTKDAVKEEGTNFDRIITYNENKEYDVQALYENTKKEVNTIIGDKLIQAMEMYFYSNYMSRRPNTAKKNSITINSDNEGYQP